MSSVNMSLCSSKQNKLRFFYFKAKCLFTIQDHVVVACRFSLLPAVSEINPLMMFNNAIHHPLMLLDQPLKCKGFMINPISSSKFGNPDNPQREKCRGTKRQHQDQTQESVGKKIQGVPQKITENRSTLTERTKHQAAFSVLNTVPLFTDNLYYTKYVLDSGTPWEKVSKVIWEKYSQHVQKPETLHRKMRLQEVVYKYIEASLPLCRGLYIVGSSITGFGCETSDMDLCLHMALKEMDQRFEAVHYLYQVQKALSQCYFLSKFELIRAKVPILRFSDTQNNLEVDLNCNNLVGVRNTFLLSSYSRIDWRVRPLVLIVKLWARQHQINDAKLMTLSSYSLALMVIHFLQTKPKPAILPCLQSMFPERFYLRDDVRTMIPFTEEEIRKLRSNNPATLGPLFAGFLQYYAEEFDYANHAISVRLGGVTRIENCRFFISPKNDPSQWKYFCIEEPFDRTNTARAVFDPVSFQRILSVFKESSKKLKVTKDLSSILP